jgi:hypothetical protein
MDREKKFTKKVYSKPSYEMEEVFEKMSLQCQLYVFICKTEAAAPVYCHFSGAFDWS